MDRTEAELISSLGTKLGAQMGDTAPLALRIGSIESSEQVQELDEIADAIRKMNMLAEALKMLGER